MSGRVSGSFRLNLTVMKLIGFYPSEKYNIFYKIYANALFVLAFALPLIFGTLHFVLIENTSAINYNDFILASIIMYPFKYLPFLRDAEEIKKCIHYFDSSEYTIVNPEHRRILEECISTCKRNSRVFFGGCIGGLIWVVGQELIGGSMETLPLNVWLPTVCRETRVVYSCTYFLLLFGIVFAALACSTIDPLIGGLSHHASAQLQILKHCLEFLDGSESSGSVYEKITKCIRRYQDIADYVEQYQKCFSPVVFSQFIGGVLVIGLCCFQLSVMEVDSNFFLNVFCLAIVFFQIFFCCYYGTLLVSENHSLSSAIYMSRWYQYDEQSKKALITLMERSKRPMVVTAGKILDLSLETFILILKRSYSFVAVLKNY